MNYKTERGEEGIHGKREMFSASRFALSKLRKGETQKSGILCYTIFPCLEEMAEG